MIGYKTDMIFLPDHDVGAVILTNSDAGQAMLGPFRRKLLEMLFDGESQADARLAAAAKSMHAHIVAERPKLTVPAAADASRALAPQYHNAALGDIDVSLDSSRSIASVETSFDFGEWKSAWHRGGTTTERCRLSPSPRHRRPRIRCRPKRQRSLADVPRRPA